ncbi:MAG: ABC transporter permease, partial [Calditrichota bacterium]
MLRTSLLFLISGIICLFLADLEVVSLDPRIEFIRMRDGLVSPAFSVLLEFYPAIINTLSIALFSTGLSIIFGAFLAFNFRVRWIRVFCSFIRSIHELFWVFLLLPVAGLNTLTGIAAIAIPYSGIFAKVFAEIIEEADKEPAKTLPVNSSQLSRFLYGTLPLIFKGCRQYAYYRLECAIRSSAVVGFIGIPTIGFHLETAFREG